MRAFQRQCRTGVLAAQIFRWDSSPKNLAPAAMRFRILKCRFCGQYLQIPVESSSILCHHCGHRIEPANAARSLSAHLRATAGIIRWATLSGLLITMAAVLCLLYRLGDYFSCIYGFLRSYLRWCSLRIRKPRQRRTSNLQNSRLAIRHKKANHLFND